MNRIRSTIYRMGMPMIPERAGDEALRSKEKPQEALPVTQMTDMPPVTIMTPMAPMPTMPPMVEQIPVVA